EPPVDLARALLDQVERQSVAAQGRQLGMSLHVVAAQELDEQVALAAEVRVERATRIARRRRDVLDASGAQAFPGNEFLGRIQQALPRLVAAVFPGEAFAAHWPS